MKINFIYLRSKISTDQRFYDGEKKAFLDALNIKNDIEISKDGINIFFIETGGTEEEFREIYKDYKEPYYILATNANNSLPASLEIASFLAKNNKRFVLIHGTPEEIHEKLGSLDENVRASQHKLNKEFRLLNNKRYGVVGKPSNWLISSDVDYKKAKDKFGCDLIDIEFKEFKNEIDNAKDIVSEVTFSELLNEKVSREILVGALKIYSALRSIIIKHDLDGVTVRCFDLLGTYHNTSCLALAMLNKDGYIAACEGDIPAMLTMAVVREAFHKSAFQVNPSYINVKERYGYFAHCTLPLDMCLDYKFDTHFESGLGIGIVGRLNLGKVTVFKVGSSLDEFECYSGKISANLHKNNLCRTQVKVEFDEDISSLLTSPLGNHLLIVTGDLKEKILSLLSK